MMYSFSRYLAARRDCISNDRPATRDQEAPDWIGSDADEVWNRISAEIATFTPIKEVTKAAHQCQVDLARLAAFADAKGPVAEATSQALLGLVIDIHHECRRIRATADGHEDFRVAGAERRLGPRHLWSWLNDPVGSGEPVSYLQLEQLRRTHRRTATGRLLFAFLTGTLLATGSPALALLTLILPVTMTGFVRYRTNAEAAATFRARYLSCLVGHLGDTAVLLGAYVWSEHNVSFPIDFAPAIALVVLLLGTSIRAGALQVGVYVPRRRVERCIRVVAFGTGIGLAALGFSAAFLSTLAIVVAFVGYETVHVFRGVWSAAGAEFAWAMRTDEGITSEMFAAPLPPRSEHIDGDLLADASTEGH